MISTSKPDSQPVGEKSCAPPAFWLPQSLRYFLFAILGLTIISLGYSLVVRQFGFGLPYSFSYPFIPGAFFSDFSEFWVRFPHFGTPGFFHQTGYFMYPSAMALVIEAFYATPHPLKAFFVFLLATGTFFTFCFYRILRRHELAVLPAALLTSSVLLTSYPYLLLLERWNTEVFLWLTITIGLWSFYRGRYAWAAICIGLATALKLYPVIFFGLFLARKRYLDIAIGVCTAIAITVIALRALSPNIAYAFAWDNAQLQAFGKYYAAAPHNLGYDHSFLAFVKFVTLPWHPDLTFLIRPYTWLLAVVCLVLYFGRIWRLPLVNQILSLSILSICVAPVSYDYTLLTLYAPLTILCISALNVPDKHQLTLVPFFLLFAAILTPLNFVIIHGAVFGAQLRVLLLVALLAIALSRPLVTVGEAA
jgi:Glycosyltransferase family 87